MASPATSIDYSKQISSKHMVDALPSSVRPVSLPISAVCLVALLSLSRSVPRFLASSLTNGRSLDLQRHLGADDATQDNPGVWVGLALMAMLMKLTASADDVVWLMPFVSTKNKRQNAFFYLFCMQLVVVISWAFSTGGEKLLGLFVPDDPNWPLARLLELISAILLTIYTLKLFWDWWQERHQGDENESEDCSMSADDTRKTPASACEVVASESKPPEHPAEAPAVRFGAEACPPQLESCTGRDDEAVTQEAESGTGREDEAVTQQPEAQAASANVNVCTNGGKQRYSLVKLFTISMFGSLDDFAVFVSLMLSGVLSAGQLVVGVFFGSMIVVAVCTGAGLCGCVVKTVEKIPLWCIIGAFAIWTYISTFALD